MSCVSFTGAPVGASACAALCVMGHLSRGFTNTPNSANLAERLMQMAPNVTKGPLIGALCTVGKDRVVDASYPSRDLFLRKRHRQGSLTSFGLASFPLGTSPKRETLSGSRISFAYVFTSCRPCRPFRPCLACRHRRRRLWQDDLQPLLRL